MIEKKDWEATKLQFEAMLVNGEINREIHLLALEHAKKKIAEFPIDPMPEEVKDIVEAAK